MAFPTDYDERDDSAVGGTIDDVIATGTITASNHNILQSAIYELERKVGKNSATISDDSYPSSLDYLLKSTSSGDPGHLHTKVGTIATGVWNGTAIADGYGGTGQTTYAKGDILYASGVDTLTKLAAGTDTHVLTLASGAPSWAAAGGGSSAFTDPVTITIDHGSNVPLTVTQEGAGNILVLENDTREILTVGSDRVVDFNLNTNPDRKPSFKFMSSGDSVTEFKMYGDPWGPPATERAIIQVHYNVASYFGIKGYDSKGAQFWFSDRINSNIFKFGSAPDDATNATLHGADEIFSVPYAAAGSFDLARPTSITVNDSGTALNVSQEAAAGIALNVDNGGSNGNIVRAYMDSGKPTFRISPLTTGGSDATSSVLIIGERSIAGWEFKATAAAANLTWYCDGGSYLWKIGSGAGSTIFKLGSGAIYLGLSGAGNAIWNYCPQEIMSGMTNGLSGRAMKEIGGWALACELRVGINDGSNLDKGGVFTAEAGGADDDAVGLLRLEQGNEAAFGYLWSDGNGKFRHGLAEPSSQYEAGAFYTEQMQASITHTTTTGTVITVPAGSIIRKVYMWVETLFNGTFTMDIGNGTDVDGFLAQGDIAEGSVGMNGIDEQDRGALLWDGTNAIGNYSASAITVVLTVSADSATAGAATIYVDYDRVH